MCWRVARFYACSLISWKPVRIWTHRASSSVAASGSYNAGQWWPFKINPPSHSQASGEHHNAFQWDLAAATTVWHLMLDAWCGYSLRLMPLDDHLGQLPVQADTLFWGLKPSKFFLICQGEEKFVPLFSNDVVQTTSWRVIFWSHFEHFDT